MQPTKLTSLIIILILMTSGVFATEYHVSKKGDNDNPGSASAPFRTISFAAQKARPGDVIIVHEGTYRERITPPRGGTSDNERIVYRAAEGERVEIKGSEVITGWERFNDDVWKVTIPNTFFGDYNPYKDEITGDWFSDHGRSHHTGRVYLNGKSLYETSILENVLKEKTIENSAGQERYPWYCETDEKNTYIYANFHGHNPNNEMVEINVRRSCFYPDEPGKNYITVRGFHMSQAATQWAPPTAEQIGLIGTHWSKGWIIENNVISDSRCTGITLGKDRATGHNVWSNNPCKDGATHYNEVIFRALESGWSKETIGSHVVSNNTISNCEQAGIVGSMGGVFSKITDNHIYNIWTERLFSGAEMAGIKIHGSIDMLIKNNHIHNVGRGIWIDWMAQGTRITGNLLYNNTTDDLFSEVNHGPYLVDNNILLSETALRDWSEGGAFVHNLMNGKIEMMQELDRFTPYHLPYSTEVAGLRNIHGGDNRFYNNIFVKGYADLPDRNNPEEQRETRATGYGLKIYNHAELPMQYEGNVYLNGAKPCRLEPNYIYRPELDPELKVVKENGHVYLDFTIDQTLNSLNNPLVTTELLGKAKIPGQSFENPDGSSLQITTDYSGKERSKSDPSVGPFEDPGSGKLKLEVW
ncbi:MAG: right-handed parallel beta-helix repeat-containing protein [Bacteroidales bacterium]